MESGDMKLSCRSCGRRVEGKREGPPCHVLEGWLTVSYWKGEGAVEHYNFCSLGCLRSWVKAQAPEVPEVFLKSFGEDEG